MDFNQTNHGHRPDAGLQNGSLNNRRNEYEDQFSTPLSVPTIKTATQDLYLDLKLEETPPFIIAEEVISTSDLSRKRSVDSADDYPAKKIQFMVPKLEKDDPEIPPGLTSAALSNQSQNIISECDVKHEVPSTNTLNMYGSLGSMNHQSTSAANMSLLNNCMPLALPSWTPQLSDAINKQLPTQLLLGVNSQPQLEVDDPETPPGLTSTALSNQSLNIISECGVKHELPSTHTLNMYGSLGSMNHQSTSAAYMSLLNNCMPLALPNLAPKQLNDAINNQLLIQLLGVYSQPQLTLQGLNLAALLNPTQNNVAVSANMLPPTNPFNLAHQYASMPSMNQQSTSANICMPLAPPNLTPQLSNATSNQLPTQLLLGVNSQPELEVVAPQILETPEVIDRESPRHPTQTIDEYCQLVDRPAQTQPMSDKQREFLTSLLLCSLPQTRSGH